MTDPTPIDFLNTPKPTCYKCHRPIYFRPIHFHQTQNAIAEIKCLQSIVRQLDQRNIDLCDRFDSLADKIADVTTMIDFHRKPVFLTDTEKDKPNVT